MGVTASDYEKAVLSQEACNLSGVVFSFADAMGKICKESRNKADGTEWKNSHPICRLYAEQICHLTRQRSWEEAYQECLSKAKGES